MTRNHNSRRNFRSFAGTAMLILGSAVLVAYSAAIAWQFHATLSSNAGDCLSLLGSIGLASLRAVGAVALDHTIALSVMHHVLILFSAFVMILIGIALFPKRALGVTAPDRGNFPAPRTGDQ